jgi:predicted CoA-binding protein
MKRPPYFSLEPIMNPKSIAVVGASENPGEDRACDTRQ